MMFGYDKETVYRSIIIILFILVDRILNSDCIVNNGNILTNGKWRCYYKMGRRICRRSV